MNELCKAIWRAVDWENDKEKETANVLDGSILNEPKQLWQIQKLANAYMEEKEARQQTMDNNYKEKCRRI